MQKKTISVKQMVFNAIMVAIYIVLSTYLAINLGPLKLTFEAMPVVLSAVIFGPWDAMLIGFIGEVLNQMLTYGFTPTTLLWVLPIVLRGGIIGFVVSLMKREQGLGAVLQSKRFILFMVVCVIAGIIHSLVNTFAYYVDSKMLGYYEYHAVFGLLIYRLAASVVSALAMGLITVPVTAALKRAKLIS